MEGDIMEVYASREEADAAEGAFQGIGPKFYGDVTSAEFDYPDVRVFGFWEDGKVRVAWSDACEYCGAPIEDDGVVDSSCGPRPVACSTCGEIANSKACHERSSTHLRP